MASAAASNEAPGAEDSPSTLFARSLKSYGEITYGPEDTKCAAVVDFDVEELTKKCNTSSPSYDPTLCDFGAISRELFVAGEKWINRDLAFIAATTVAQLHGWHAKLKQEHILCNRFGEDKSKRNLTHTLPAGCTWKVTMKPLVKERYFAKDGKSKKPSYRSLWDKPVVISSAVCAHGGNCKPGRANRIAVVQRAGKYVESMPSNALYSLCNFMENGGRLSSSLIKKVLQPVWPRAKEISKHDVFNIRVKVMRLLPTYRKTNGEYEEWKKVANANDMLRGIDNTVSLDDDEAYELAHTLCLEVMESAKGNDDEIFSFIEYLDLIKARAKGFTYKLARDASDGKKKLLGVLWQTATMRRNFELFGSYICLDMMKRGINTLLWPYVAVSMYDEMKKLCIGCEGILCGERTDMYKFLSTFLAESSPGRPLSLVLVVSGDGFFDEELVTDEPGFVNAVYFSDQWHLVDSGLEKMFGKAGYGVLKGHLEKMVYAKSEYEFNDTLRAAKELLQAQPVRNGQWESDLNAFAARRHTYSTMCPHEIVAKNGFQLDLFQPMHLVRECVAGSLVGWTDNGTSGIDEILGYAAESIVSPPAGGTPDGISGDADSGTMVQQAPYATNPPGQNVAPPGYVAETGGAVQPLDKKTVQNIFNAALASFSNLSKDRKMEVSQVALQLQDMLTAGHGQSRNAQRDDGLSVAVPTNSCLASQPKKRPKPRREHEADTQSKRLKTSIQNLGLAQVIVGKENSIHVNGKASKRKGCQFCGGNHAYPSCDIRLELKKETSEYMLTSTNPQAEILLRNRITSSMPLSGAGGGKGAPITVLASKHRAMNFIIHEACQVAGQPLGRVESMNFCVSFLDKGCVMEDGKELWVAGCAMNSIVAHSNKKIKFVFDETIFHKEGWTHPDAIAKAEV